MELMMHLKVNSQATLNFEVICTTKAICHMIELLNLIGRILRPINFVPNLINKNITHR